MPNKIRPLKATKTKPAGWLVLVSHDHSAWIVCGDRCAARVPRTVPFEQAVEHALANPDLFVTR